MNQQDFQIKKLFLLFGSIIGIVLLYIGIKQVIQNFNSATILWLVFILVPAIMFPYKLLNMSKARQKEENNTNKSYTNNEKPILDISLPSIYNSSLIRSKLYVYKNKLIYDSDRAARIFFNITDKKSSFAPTIVNFSEISSANIYSDWFSLWLSDAIKITRSSGNTLVIRSIPKDKAQEIKRMIDSYIKKNKF